jgi:hypothetical protein
MLAATRYYIKLIRTVSEVDQPPRLSMLLVVNFCLLWLRDMDSIGICGVDVLGDELLAVRNRVDGVRVLV